MTKYKEYIQKMRPNDEILINGIEAAMTSMGRHQWYLDETMIPLALCDQDLDANHRAAIAKAIVNQNIPEVFEHPERSDSSILNKLDFSTEDPPMLDSLVGPNSWFILDFLGFGSKISSTWLWTPPELWPDIPGYQKLETFVKQIKVVNDGSERGINLISNYVNKFHKEDDRQDLLLAVQRYRDILRGATTKDEMQAAYEKLRK